MKYSISFGLKKTIKNYCIRVRVSSFGIRNEYLLGYSIDLKDWDENTKRVRRTAKFAAKINNNINRCQILFDEFFMRCELDRVEITKELIDETFNAEFRPERIKKTKNGFYDIFDKFVSEQSIQNSWSFKNIQKFQTLKNNLYQYNPSLVLNELTESDLQGFLLIAPSRN